MLFIQCEVSDQMNLATVLAADTRDQQSAFREVVYSGVSGKFECKENENACGASVTGSASSFLNDD